MVDINQARRARHMQPRGRPPSKAKGGTSGRQSGTGEPKHTASVRKVWREAKRRGRKGPRPEDVQDGPLLALPAPEALAMSVTMSVTEPHEDVTTLAAWCWATGIALIGNVAVLMGTLTQIIPGSMGPVPCGVPAAFMIAAVEVVVGHRRDRLRKAGRPAGMLLAVILVCLAAEEGVAYKRVLLDHQARIEAARHEAQADRGAQEEAPRVDLAAIGAHPKTMTGAIDAAGESHRKDVQQEEELRTKREGDAEDRAKQTNADSDWVDKFVQLVVAAVACLGSVTMAPIFGEYQAARRRRAGAP